MLRGVIVVVMSMGRRKAVGKTMILIFPTPMMPTACLMLKLISIRSLSVCVITWRVTKSATRSESVLMGHSFQGGYSCAQYGHNEDCGHGG